MRHRVDLRAPDNWAGDRQAMERLSVGSEAFFRQMGALIGATGSDGFYARLAEFAATLLDCDRWLVMRYAHYAMPEFVLNEAMSEEAVAFYLDGLYRLDPLLRISRNGPRRGVYTLSQLKDRESRSAYYDDIFRTALIYDELAILFPAPGRVCIALCLDRDSRRFSAREVRMIEGLYRRSRACTTRTSIAPSPRRSAAASALPWAIRRRPS